MPKIDPRPLRDLLEERARRIAEFARRQHADGDPSDQDLDQFGADLVAIDREILGRPHTDAPSAALALRAKVALEYVPLPMDEPGGASEIELLAVRALRASLRQMAVRGETATR